MLVYVVTINLYRVKLLSVINNLRTKYGMMRISVLLN
jgi:hypothetical protein